MDGAALAHILQLIIMINPKHKQTVYDYRHDRGSRACFAALATTYDRREFRYIKYYKSCVCARARIIVHIPGTWCTRRVAATDAATMTVLVSFFFFYQIDIDSGECAWRRERERRGCAPFAHNTRITVCGVIQHGNSYIIKLNIFAWNVMVRSAARFRSN